MAQKGGAVHYGDVTHRVDAPLPRSLTELIGRAEVHFGHTGTLKLYHKGRVPITKNSQLEQIKDDDVVVVTWDDRRLSPGGFAEMVSTHRHDFVPHKPGSFEETCFRPKPSPPLPLPFQGDSDYRINYVGYKVGHPRESQRPRSETSLRRPHPNDHPHPESTYVATYRPPHHPRRRDRPYKKEVGPAPAVAKPFTGESVYARDFSTRERPRSLTPGVPGPRDRPWAERPFDGVSTYKTAYVQWPFEKKRTPSQWPPKACLPKIVGPAKEAAPPAPTPKRLWIHLEPEVGKVTTRDALPTKAQLRGFLEKPQVS